MDTKKLRQKILDLAIRGKLVPQDPNDEPASVLLERIRAEKERLIAEGKIKRPKKSKASSSESHYQNFEPPFEIPNSWEWVSMKEIFLSMEKRVPCDKKFSYIDIDSIDNKRNIAIPKTVDAKSAPSRASRRADKGDIVFSLVRPYLRNIALVPKNNCIASTGLYVFTPSDAIDSYYAFRLLLSEYVVNGLNSFMKGDNSPSINVKNVEEFIVALPPLSEQKRISNKIETVFQLLTIIEDEKEVAIKNISKVKSKILELAMQGKLVPQDRADEPAAEMLKRINPNAKIITDNPHSWNIPNGWCMTDLKSIGKWQSGATPSKLNPEYYGKGYPWLNTGDLNDGFITSIPKEITELAVKETSVKLNPKGSVLIAMYGATIGKLGILEIDATTNQACCACANCFIDNKFLFDFLLYYRPKFIQLGGGGAQPNISKVKIESTVMLLPPLNEQRRIVYKIEELYACLDKIEASLQS